FPFGSWVGCVLGERENANDSRLHIAQARPDLLAARAKRERTPTQRFIEPVTQFHSRVRMFLPARGGTQSDRGYGFDSAAGEICCNFCPLVLNNLDYRPQTDYIRVLGRKACPDLVNISGIVIRPPHHIQDLLLRVAVSEYKLEGAPAIHLLDVRFIHAEQW